MPYFCECGADEYLCQVCGLVRCSAHKPAEWRPDITVTTTAANVCPDCVKAHDAKDPRSKGRIRRIENS